MIICVRNKNPVSDIDICNDYEVNKMEVMKGRIVDIEKYQNQVAYIKQGIQGCNQHKYDNYPGGNGTYVTEGDVLKD